MSSIVIGYRQMEIQQMEVPKPSVARFEWVLWGARDAVIARGPIFVFGMPRSGTTLVEQLIAAHPSAAAIGETGFFKKVLAEATRKRPAQEPFIDRVRSLNARDFAQIGEAYERLARERGGSAGARRDA